MQKRTRFLILSTCLATILCAVAQARDCPHEKADLNPGFSWSKGPNYCVTSIEMGGLKIPLHQTWCPGVTIIMPTYHGCESSPESETRCQLVGVKHVYRINRVCRSVTIATGIRVELCVVVSKTIVGTVNEYKTVPCDEH